MDFNDKIEALMKRLTSRVEVIMSGFEEAFVNEGWTTDGVCFMDGDDYTWSLQLFRPECEGDDDESIDVSFTICEQQSFEGPEDADGLTFRVDLVEYGGRILGGMCPFNYTEECWIPIDEEERVEERFNYFELADPSEAVAVADG